MLAKAFRQVNCAAEFAQGSAERDYCDGLMQNQTAMPQKCAALENY